MSYHSKKRDRMVEGRFTPLPASLFTSTAWEALSPTAMKLFGLMVAADANEQRDDGRFPFTHADFIKRGIGHNNIGPALRELECAGIIKRVLKGFGGPDAKNRSASFYRLTTYKADGPQAFLEALPREEWIARLTMAKAAKDMSHDRNDKPKARRDDVRKERIFSDPKSGTLQ
jgi:hypothetical protein